MAALSEDQVEEQLFNALMEAASGLPLVHRVVVVSFVHRIQELAELRRARQANDYRLLAQLHARVEALERPGVMRMFAGSRES